MACFVVPATEAIVVTAINKLSAKKSEERKDIPGTEKIETDASSSVPFRDKVKWLQNMLWGGSALLAFEHVWHGEVVPWFPFLTAAENPADFAEMLAEMSTTGVTMAVLVTAVWGLMLLGARAIERRSSGTGAKFNKPEGNVQ